MKFADLDLKPEILSSLGDMGYVDLTPIQEKTYPHILAGKDIIARSETGSGKTAACGIPLVQNVDPNIKAVQSLILVPTRELALQYVSEISDIAAKLHVSPFAIYGGFSMQTQLAKLKHGVDILVATPGRLIDMLSNTSLSLSEVRTFVLDEADEMLNMGFISDLEWILSCLIHDHQSLLFSATMPKKVEQLAKKYLSDPITIYIGAENKTPQNLEHRFIMVKQRNKFDALKRFLEESDPKQTIIFCNSRRSAETLHKELKKANWPATDIVHGGMEQSLRTSLFNRFRKKDITTIVATDLAARGLDFAHTSHVINYDLPKFTEAYTHRTGRTARMGRSGVALTLFTSSELRGLKDIIRKNGIEPKWEGRKPDLSGVKKKKNREREKRKKFYRKKKSGS